MVIRWLILLSWEGFCFFKGGTREAFYGFLLFGLAAMLWYTIIDTWHRLEKAAGGLLSRSEVNVDARQVNLYPDGEQARRGVPVTTEDFAGMIEYRKGRRL